MNISNYMSIKVNLQKLKKKCQEKLYNSIDNCFNISGAQTYIPAFNNYVKIDELIIGGENSDWSIEEHEDLVFKN